MLNRCYSLNGAIDIVYRCDKLLITGYRYAQEVDSEVGQMIYLLQRVVLMKFLPNEQFLTENPWELHKNSKKY